MASRQLRKLRKQQELLTPLNETADASDGSEDEPIVAKPRANMFSGFAALGDVGDDDGADGDEEEEQHVDEPDNAAPTPVTSQEQADAQGEAAKKSKKKSSKKKKKKAKQAEAAPPAQDERDSIDEIDRVLEELKLEAQSPAGPATAATATVTAGAANTLNDLLRINFHHLKAMNEMRRLFGKAMDVAEVEERTQDNRQRTLTENLDLETFLSARAAHPGQGPKGNKSMFDTILRTNPFIDGKKTWPRGTAQGLKMIRASEGLSEEVEFAFAHDSAYDALEAAFFGLVQMFDPMQIVHFLHRYPYHVSSLIQVSKVARQDQNSALAADLIERALFTFGRASLSEFRRKLEKGQARLSFARPENRQFYLAGHNLIQKLVLKGTYRTALEWAKLFLSLNHDDPYAMLNWIHVLALRAREPHWFIDFCSSPLLDTAPAGIYTKQTLSLAHLQLGDASAAQTTLTTGMRTLPWLYCALFSALNLDTPPSVWGIQPRTDDEALHTDLYIHTTKDLWNTPATISLLKSAASSLPSRIDPDPLPPSPPVSLATARFVYLDNTPSLMASVPRQMLHATPNFDFDPLPPPWKENVFSSAAQRRPWEVVDHEFVRSAALANAAGAWGPGGGGGGDVEGFRAAFAAHQVQLRQRLAQQQAALLAAGGGEGQGEGEGGGQGGDGEGGDEGDEEQETQGPGLLDHLMWFLRGGQVVQPDELLGPSTGMPGGWDETDYWGEEEERHLMGEDDEFEGGDDFEGEDDFEGGGGHE